MRDKGGTFYNIAVFVIAIGSLTAAPAWSAALPFCDDFEAHLPGAAPSPPWFRAYNQNSIIVTPGFAGSAQCVKLRGAWNWSDTLYVDLQLEPGKSFPFSAGREERALYILSGELEIAGDRFAADQLLVFRAGDEITLTAGAPRRCGRKPDNHCQLILRRSEPPRGQSALTEPANWHRSCVIERHLQPRASKGMA